MDHSALYKQLLDEIGKSVNGANLIYVPSKSLYPGNANADQLNEELSQYHKTLELMNDFDYVVVVTALRGTTHIGLPY